MPDTEKEKEWLQEKRRQFFEAGEPLFERYGFRKTTIEDICQASGISKRTFYDLFKDKPDFFARMALDIAEILIAQWESGLPKDMNAPSKIMSFIDYYVNVIIQRPVFGLIMKDQVLLHALSALGPEWNLSPVIDSMRRIIDQGKAEETFREMDTDTVVWMIMSLMDSMYLLLPEYFKFPPEEDISVTMLTLEIKQFIIRALESGR